MFGIGLPEMILIVAVALIVVGPDKLPELAKTLARQVGELKRAANTLKRTLNEESESGAVVNSEGGAPTRFLQLSSHSRQTLPGDQWVHEQGTDAIEISHQNIPSDRELPTVNTGAASVA